MQGDQALRALFDDLTIWQSSAIKPDLPEIEESTQLDHERVQSILRALNLDRITPDEATANIDRVLLHPVFGPAILVLLLFLIFFHIFEFHHRLNINFLIILCFLFRISRIFCYDRCVRKFCASREGPDPFF